MRTSYRVIVVAVAGGLLWAVAAGAAETRKNEIGMSFVRVPAGDFVMGTEDLEAALFELPTGDPSEIADEAPAHRVAITEPFWLGRTEVTQGQWLEVMDSRPGPEKLWERDDWRRLPVVSVTWHEVQAFVTKLSAQDPDARYRLPSEAEWEYAARAGARGLRPVPKERLPQHAWYIENSDDESHPVATRRPNDWGLHDMLGNVWEWTADWYGPEYYEGSPREDPGGPEEGERRVRRGGSYHCKVHLVRPGYRGVASPDKAYSVLGFRVVMEPSP